MAYLEISKGKALLQSPLDKDAMSIGRLPGNSIVINDPDISRRHCVIEREQDTFRIYDLGSRHGTLVNGQRVQRAELQPGDVITLGGTIARFLDVAPHKAAAAPLPVSSSGIPESLSAPAPRAARNRHWLIWLPALTIFLLAAFIVVWAMGLLGGRFSVADLRQRLGLSAKPEVTTAPAIASPDAPAVPTAASNPNDVPQRELNPPAPRTDLTPASDGDIAAPSIEPDAAVARYRLITRETALPALERLLGQYVSARFIGKPIVDDGNQLIWELPPDGTIVAVFEVTAAGAAQLVLETIQNEPLLIEAEVCGRLVRDAATGRLVLRAGVIEVLHAWGNRDDSLQPTTLQLLNKRIVVNPNAQAGANDADGN